MPQLARDVLGIVIFLIVIIAIIAAVAGLVLVFITKAAGVILILFGLFMMLVLPDIHGQGDYQPTQFGTTGIILGILVAIAGVILLVI